MKPIALFAFILACLLVFFWTGQSHADPVTDAQRQVFQQQIQEYQSIVAAASSRLANCKYDYPYYLDPIGNQNCEHDAQFTISAAKARINGYEKRLSGGVSEPPVFDAQEFNRAQQEAAHAAKARGVQP